MTAVKPRSERKDHRKEPVVLLGHRDPMSVAAKAASMPLCRQHNACTRAQGHAEGSPGTKHVAAPRGIATAIWEDTP